MNQYHPPSAVASQTPPRLGRRRFLGLGAASSLVVAGGYGIRRSRLGSSIELDRIADALAEGPSPLRAGDRVLVMIQLAGGLDGLGAVVPLRSERLAELRGDEAVSGDIHDLDGDVGLRSMPGLAQAWQAGELAIVHGVGHERPSMSHFEETERWERGALDDQIRTGWLGRCLDALGGDGQPLAGLSIGALSPSLVAERARPIAVPPGGWSAWTADYIDGHPDLARAEQARRESGVDEQDHPLAALARESQSRLMEIAGHLAVEDEAADDEDDQLRPAGIAQLLSRDLPIRVVHATLDGFDTHAGQGWELPYLLGRLDEAVTRLRSDLGDAGDRVVIATWTEFGRRPDWNGDGTDHGSAGTQFVIGAGVEGGHHGEPSPLDDLDEEGNLRPTCDYRDYLAGLAGGVLGVDPALAVPEARNPMELLA